MIPISWLRIVPLILAWGWVGVLLQPADLITFYPQYDRFEAIGGTHYWLCWSIGIAGVSTLGQFPLFPHWRVWAMAIQMGWWLVVSLLFALRFPAPTGAPGYLAFGVLCAMIAIGSLRSGRRDA